MKIDPQPSYLKGICRSPRSYGIMYKALPQQGGGRHGEGASADIKGGIGQRGVGRGADGWVAETADSVRG